MFTRTKYTFVDFDGYQVVDLEDVVTVSNLYSNGSVNGTGFTVYRRDNSYTEYRFKLGDEAESVRNGLVIALDVKANTDPFTLRITSSGP